MDILEKCMLCPRICMVNRYKNVGFCRAGSKIKVAYYSLHHWEEPVISGTSGSGTIFFSNCNLGCIFCQNKKISTSSNTHGKEIENDRLKDIILELQDKGAHNINLVTPTHYVPQIISVLKEIKNKDLKIPVVYNTGSYENVSTIDSLDGLVDIYLADLKYFDNKLGLLYSGCKDYFYHASRAIDAMYRQVGKYKIYNDLMCTGLIVRILVLPGHIDDSKIIIKYLYDKYKDNIIISIMNQYTPVDVFKEFSNLNRKLSDSEYDEVIEYAYSLGIRNAFMQDGDTQDTSFIPDFDSSIV